MRLHGLTNPHPLLQEKMRFFADFFTFANEFLGKIPGLSFDNPLSLVDKILFQIENNLERCPKSVSIYLRYLERYEKEYLDKAVPSYAAMKSAFVVPFGSLAEDKEKKKWLKENRQIISKIAAVKEELEATLFDTMLEWVRSYIKCSHDLSTHKQDIVFATQIIVSHFRLNYADKKEVNEYIQRILSDDKYKFPFPVNIREQNKSEKYDEVCQHFLANRNFDQQFDGLKNIVEAHKNRKGYFLFPVTKILIGKEIKNGLYVAINDVTFISGDHPKMKMIKDSIAECADHKPLYNIFFGENRILAMLELSYDRRDITSKLGRKIVEKELIQFNAYLGSDREAALLPGHHFLFTDDFSDGFWSSSSEMASDKSVFVGMNEMECLSENPYQRLKTAGAKAFKEISRNEITFIRAWRNEEIEAYWLYAENLFWTKDQEKKEVKRRCRQLAKLYTDWQCRVLETHTGLLLGPYDRELVEDDIGLSKTEMDGIHFAIAHEEKYPFDWQPYTGRIKHPFLLFMIDALEKVKSDNGLESWDQYFEDVFQELFDYRNAELHTGIVNQYSKMKLSIVAPEIFTAIRNDIIETAIEHPDLNHEMVLELMINNNGETF